MLALVWAGFRVIAIRQDNVDWAPPERAPFPGLRSAPPRAIPSLYPRQKELRISPSEPQVTEALAIEHGLKPDEYARFVS